MELSTITVAGGRTLEVGRSGPPDRMPLVFHHGTPGCAAPFALVERAAEAAGLAYVTWSRPGYGDSARERGRTVASVASDATRVLDALGVDAFVTLGWSGGGPHALALAALLPDRCLAAATLAGVAPHSARDLDWMAGMGEDNIEEFGAALRGEEAITALLESAPWPGRR